MTIQKRMQTAINKQINAELYSAYLYLSMATYFEADNFNGFAHWMKKQAHEELEHAMRFYSYVFERGGQVTLDAIKKPTATCKSPLDAFTKALKHEQEITSLIHKLVDLANTTKDHATTSFLKWFVDEQVEEEASASDIVEKLKLIGDSKGSLYMLDKQLGKRK
jgi:ferritin